MSDTIYFSAGFFQGNNGIGQHYSISYQNVTFTSDSSSLETTELFRTNLWMHFPVTFVGLHKADYSPVPPASVASDYQFWFVFLRESFNSDVIYSRLVRICRNDQGSSSSPDSFFNSFMMARILCERNKPSERASTSSLDYKYNSISELFVLLSPPAIGLSVCLSVCLLVCLSVCLPVCLSVCLSACLPVCLSACLSACLSVCLSVCLYVCLPACLSVCTSVCLPVCVPVCLSLSVYLS